MIQMTMMEEKMMRDPLNDRICKFLARGINKLTIGQLVVLCLLNTHFREGIRRFMEVFVVMLSCYGAVPV